MTTFLMPSLGADMEAGKLVEWLKQPGDKFTRGESIAVVETQKGAIEIEIFQDGTLARALVQPGTRVPVGAPLAEIEVKGEAALAPAAPAPIVAAERPPAVIAPPAMVPPLPGGMPAASPAARRFAAEHDIDLKSIAGSGPDGAITFVDVERALEVQPKGKPVQPTGVNLTEMRKAIAAAMSRAKREIPHYYLTHTVDIGAAQEWLDGANGQRAPADRLLLGALLVKATAKALAGMPDFNGFFIDGAYHPSNRVHVGMAIVVRGGGLIAPAIHDADQLTLDAVMAKLRDLVARVRSGRLRGSELTDSTITISSLGERGVDSIQAIIHPPQVAIVGFGTPQVRPWVLGDTVVGRPLMTATLAADHRVSDGHRGALFLSAITKALETPETL